MTKRELSRVLEWIKRARERCMYKPFFGKIYLHDTPKGFYIACCTIGQKNDFEPNYYCYSGKIEDIERLGMLEQFLSENRKYIQSVDLHAKNKSEGFPWQFIYNSTNKLYVL